MQTRRSANPVGRVAFGAFAAQAVRTAQDRANLGLLNLAARTNDLTVRRMAVQRRGLPADLADPVDRVDHKWTA
jgi:hypothetical protein